MSDNEVKFTEEDIDSCWYHSKSYMVEILNGEYSLVEAREDLLSLIGSKHDLRTAEAMENSEPATVETADK